MTRQKCLDVSERTSLPMPTEFVIGHGAPNNISNMPCHYAQAPGTLTLVTLLTAGGMYR